MLNRIDFILIPKTQYGVLNHFLEKLYEAFTRHGVEGRILKSGNPTELFESLTNSPPQLTLSFNGMPRYEPDRLLCDLFHTPHLSCLVDPFYRFPYLQQSPYSIIACDDKIGCQLLKTGGFNHSLFLPHAVEREACIETTDERIYDITMLASFIHHNAIYKSWKNELPDFLCDALDETIEAVFSDGHVSFIEAFLTAYDQQRFSPEWFPPDQDILSKLLEHLELYIKAKDRIDLLRSITDIPIHIFGNIVGPDHWQQKFKKSQPNLIFHDSVDYSEAMQIMRQSKILLNSAIKNQQGAHERIFTGMACGALVVTNETEYMLEHFVDGKDVILFKHSQLEKCSNQIRDLLSNENKRRQIAENGREAIKKAHTWDHRVEMLLEKLPPILKSVRASTS